MKRYFESGAQVQAVDANDRVFAMDVLRGVALFGVLLANMVFFAHDPFMATSQQLLALPTVGLDGALYEVIRWLVAGKAYTLFAFLFGLGFYLQMQRAGSRGARFESIYLRRLTVLLLFGVAHALFVWAWDILHLYALAGFTLFALRRASDRLLLFGGLALALFGLPMHEAWMEYSSYAEWHGRSSPYTDVAIIARQTASTSGSYFDAFGAMLDFTLTDWVLSGLFLGWLAWSLGRFMVGAWVGRRGWIQDAQAHLPGFRRVTRIVLPAGLIFCGLGLLLQIQAEAGWLPVWEHWEFSGKVLHLIATPVLTMGYVCAIVVALRTPRGRTLLAPFAQAGRMALSNYVGQSLIIGFVLFGAGPGLGMAGRIGTTALTAVVIVAFSAQVAFSSWWLMHYRYGPLEWLWRALTYGRWPALRKPAQGEARA